MKKILFLSPLPPPSYGSALSSKMCLQILEADEKFEVRMIQLNYSKSMRDVGKMNPKKVFGFISVRTRIRRQLKAFKPDIIYFAPAVTGFALIRDFWFLRILKSYSKDKELILHLRGQFKNKDLKRAVRKYMIRDMLRADKIIVLGGELINNVTDISNEMQITVLPNAIENTILDLEYAGIEEARNKNQFLQLLFFSNMHESKGWFKVLEACKLLKYEGVAYHCHFVGEWTSPKEKIKFDNYIDEHCLRENVIYHGGLFGDGKKKIFTTADMLIYPSEDDACPRVIIEAMEYGLPIIGSKIGAIPSLIDHGKTGLVLKENTSNEICRSIGLLSDKATRQLFGLNARKKFMKQMTLDTYRSKFISIFNN